MSSKLLGQVWDYQFTKAEQSVMLAMADHAKDDGTDCYPSVERIAWKTDYSERQVRRVIHDLTRRGILILVRKSGRNRATEYKIDLTKADPKPEFRHQKADTMSAYAVKADTMSAQDEVEKVDTMSAQDEVEKVDAMSAYPEKADTMSTQQNAIGGHLAANGRTFEGLKADIAMSPKPLTIKPSEGNGIDPSVAWMQVLEDFRASQPSNSPAIKWLATSRLSKVCDLAGIPLYRIEIADAAGVEWLNNRMCDWFRRTLAVALKTRVQIEIVAAEMAVAA